MDDHSWTGKSQKKPQPEVPPEQEVPLPPLAVENLDEDLNENLDENTPLEPPEPSPEPSPLKESISQNTRAKARGRK